LIAQIGMQLTESVRRIIMHLRRFFCNSNRFAILPKHPAASRSCRVVIFLRPPGANYVRIFHPRQKNAKKFKLFMRLR
jgi:hypothetical protein